MTINFIDFGCRSLRTPEKLSYLTASLPSRFPEVIRAGETRLAHFAGVSKVTVHSRNFRKLA